MLRIEPGWAYTDKTWESQVESPKLGQEFTTVSEVDSGTRLSETSDTGIDK